MLKKHNKVAHAITSNTQSQTLYQHSTRSSASHSKSALRQKESLTAHYRTQNGYILNTGGAGEKTGGAKTTRQEFGYTIGQDTSMGSRQAMQCLSCGKSSRICTCKSPKLILQTETTVTSGGLGKDANNSINGLKSQMKFTISHAETVVNKPDKKLGTKSSQYTIYHISVRTCINEWSLTYRYSELSKFHDNVKFLLKIKYLQLKRIMKGSSEIPKFPAKKLWKNKEKVIQERQKQLQDYLNQLSASVDLIQLEYACHFLNIDSYLREYLSDLQVRSTGETPVTDPGEKSNKHSRNRSVFKSLLGNQSKNSKNSHNRLDSQIELDFSPESAGDESSFATGKYQKFTKSAVEMSNGKQQYQTNGRISLGYKKMMSSSMIKFPNSNQIQTAKSVSKDALDMLPSNIDLITLQKQHKLTDEEVVLKFFKNINHSDQRKDHYIRDFEDYYFKTRPNFQSKLIKVLIEGDMMIGVQGLLILMSEIESSYVSACTAIHLISKLIDFQKNIYAESFIKELIKIDPKHMKLYKFEAFLEKQNSEGHRKSALHILQTYVERRMAFKNTLGSIASNIRFDEDLDNQKMSRTLQIKNETEEQILKIILINEKFQQEVLMLLTSKQNLQCSFTSHKSPVVTQNTLGGAIQIPNHLLSSSDMKKMKSNPEVSLHSSTKKAEKKVNASFMIQKKKKGICNSNDQSFNISLSDSCSQVNQTINSYDDRNENQRASSDLDLDSQLKSQSYLQMSLASDSPRSDHLQCDAVLNKLKDYDFDAIFEQAQVPTIEKSSESFVGSFEEVLDLIQTKQNKDCLSFNLHNELQSNSKPLNDIQSQIIQTYQCLQNPSQLTLQNFTAHQQFVSSLKSQQDTQMRVLKYLDHQKQLLEVNIKVKEQNENSEIGLLKVNCKQSAKDFSCAVNSPTELRQEQKVYSNQDFKVRKPSCSEKITNHNFQQSTHKIRGLNLADKNTTVSNNSLSPEHQIETPRSTTVTKYLYVEIRQQSHLNMNGSREHTILYLVSEISPSQIESTLNQNEDQDGTQDYSKKTAGFNQILQSLKAQNTEGAFKINEFWMDNNPESQERALQKIENCSPTNEQLLAACDTPSEQAQSLDRHAVLSFKVSKDSEGKLWIKTQMCLMNYCSSIIDEQVHLKLIPTNLLPSMQEQSPTLSDSLSEGKDNAPSNQLEQLISSLQESLTSTQVDARGSDASTNTLGVAGGRISGKGALGLNFNKSIIGNVPISEEDEFSYLNGEEESKSTTHFPSEGEKKPIAEMRVKEGRMSYISEIRSKITEGKFLKTDKFRALFRNQASEAQPMKQDSQDNSINLKFAGNRATLKVLQQLLKPLMLKQIFGSSFRSVSEDQENHQILSNKISENQMLCQQDISQSLIDMQIKETQFTMIHI